jgi:hypothetical protein
VTSSRGILAAPKAKLLIKISSKTNSAIATAIGESNCKEKIFVSAG